MNPNPIISVIGLGYVGLPVALAMAKRYRTFGFDIDSARIAELRRGVDKNAEWSEPALREPFLQFTDQEISKAVRFSHRRGSYAC